MLMNERKFREGDRVEWMVGDVMKYTGTVVEYSEFYDPITMTTRYRYLVKNDNGCYNGLDENRLKSLEK